MKKITKEILIEILSEFYKKNVNIKRIPKIQIEEFLKEFCNKKNDKCDHKHLKYKIEINMHPHDDVIEFDECVDCNEIINLKFF